MRENSLKDSGAANKDCRFRNFDKFPTPATFACWKTKFLTEVCICSQFPTEAMLWIKEVDGWISGWSEIFVFYQRILGPDFEVLDARIASALNRIIQNTRFKKKVSLEEQKAQKEDHFYHGKQFTYLIYDYFRVTGANDSVENCADLCTISLRNDDIQEFDSKFDGISLSMTKIPRDDILEGLHKWRTRESEKFKFVFELYDGPENHRLKTMVKQNLRVKNFEARNWNCEKNAVVKNQGIKQREERSLGDCWQWKSNEQCSIDTAECFSKIFHAAECEKNASKTRSPGGWSPSGNKTRLPCKDYVKGTCTHPLCDKWHPPECCSTSQKMDIIFVETALMCIVKLANNVTKSPKRMVTIMHWLCSRLHLGCEFQDTKPSKSSSTTEITVDDGVQTFEEATVYCEELETFLTKKVIENTSAVLLSRKVCDEHGHS